MTPMTLRKPNNAAIKTITIAAKMAPSFSSCQVIAPVVRPVAHPVKDHR